MSDDLRPIEPLIRLESPPDDATVVIRGGPITADKIVEHAVRQQAVFSFSGRPMVAVSVDLTLPGWSLDRILRERMWSRSTYAVTTARRLQSAGYLLVPTSAAPHFSVVLPRADAGAAREFLRHFGPTMKNQHRQRRR